MPLRFLDERRRPTKPTWIGGGVVALLLIGGIAPAVAPEPAETAAAPTATAPAPSTPAAEPSAESTLEETAAAAEPLAPRVDAALRQTWGVQNPTDGLAGQDGHDPSLLNRTISSMEDQSVGIVHVTVQVAASSTTNAEVEQLAKNIVRLSQDQSPELDWVVVRTADGRILEQSARLAHGQ